MNILLIGGSGFVGNSIISKALEKNINISYLSRNKTNNNITWIQGDIFNIDNISIEENFDVAIHLIGTIKNKNLYSKLNTQSVQQSIELCKKHNIKKLVYVSAQGGFKDYLNSKKAGENLVEHSNLDYLIIRPGLMYGTNRISSYFNVIPIKILSSFEIPFFKNVYPLPVEKVADKVLEAIKSNTNKKYLNIEDLK